MDNNNLINQPGRPPADANNGLETIFTKIQPYLQLSYSFHKACLLAQIPYSTYKKYFDGNEDFRNKIEKERSQVSLTARRNIVNKINGGDTKLSLRWLESFEKEDFNIEPLDKNAIGRETLAQVEKILEEINNKNNDGITYQLTDKKNIVGYESPSWFVNPDEEEVIDSNNEQKVNNNS